MIIKEILKSNKVIEEVNKLISKKHYLYILGYIDSALKSHAIDNKVYKELREKIDKIYWRGFITIHRIYKREVRC